MPANSKAKQAKSAKPLPPERKAERIALKDLHFDPRNPRFGPHAENIKKNESQILDRIVEVHGVGDLLSSLAVNGFSDAEPVVGLRNKDGSILIKEGNRRLAACLILDADPRAKNQKKRIERYQTIRERHGNRLVNPIPVIVFEQSEYELILPYLGVKHIVGAEEWSAWAKAAWADELINEHDITLQTAMDMIGDEQRQLPRILASYYFVQQLIETRRFNPADSMKRGGGGSEFPFSLIYNALGYSNIKEWVGFPSESEPIKNPIPPAKLDEAADLMDFICGNEAKDLEPVIRDNREFKFLNRIAGDRESIAALKRGEPLEKVAQRMEPAPSQLMDGLVVVRQHLEELVAMTAREQLSPKDTSELLPPSKSVALLATSLYNSIRGQNEEPQLNLFGSPQKSMTRKGARRKN